MSEYRVVNPATGEVEREFPTATDAEIESLLERSESSYAALGRTSLADRAAVLRGRGRPVPRAIHRAGRADHPGDGQDDGRGGR